ncbi:Na+/H+ antiporter subunit D [Plantactinospora sp. KLBMP9567]|uniref:Na+/H+ antiporter subunit D n=1 Tax=Plantactinospora sp. KLBMP9567 TaxID=3085900 RepID=UPI0029824400|nr:Na+/H+ antiporter subunit D [Plantactinospora sp. KLBMP9567]MDW5329674.1 Na+/H+ antiporter subunit D [Plantactinospora sp. KLBMP9567]
MSGAVLVSTPVVVPLLAAGASALLAGFLVVQRILGLGVLAVVLIASVLLLVRVDGLGTQSIQVGGWQPPLGITLVADRFSALVLVVAVLVCLLVLVFAVGQGSAERRVEDVPSVFHPTYLVLLAGIALVLISGDLFTLFVGFEVMLMASYVLITLGATRERVRAGLTYVVSSLTASILLLTTIGLVYAVTGTVNLAQLSAVTVDLPPGTRGLLALLLLVALGIKAAMVPLHWWLPDSYPTAAAPVTAIFAALLTKVAVYAIIRTQTLLFPRQEPWTLLLVIAALTMLVGVLGALVQDDLNRILSFVLVSHVGFMLFGLAIFSVAGLAGAVLYLVHHITVQTALFLVSGLIERERQSVSLARLGGLAATAPVVAALFLIPAFSLGGLPPFAGFVGKLALLQAAVAQAGPVVLATAAVALLTSLLTLSALMRIWLRVFWSQSAAPAPADADGATAAGSPGGRLPGRVMRFAALTAVLSGLAVAATAGPLAALSQRAAADLLDRDGYRGAVLGHREVE